MKFYKVQFSNSQTLEIRAESIADAYWNAVEWGRFAREVGRIDSNFEIEDIE